MEPGPAWPESKRPSSEVIVCWSSRTTQRTVSSTSTRASAGVKRSCSTSTSCGRASEGAAETTSATPAAAITAAHLRVLRTKCASPGRRFGEIQASTDRLRQSGYGDAPPPAPSPSGETLCEREAIDGATMYALMAGAEGWPETEWI